MEEREQEGVVGEIEQKPTQSNCNFARALAHTKLILARSKDVKFAAT